MVAHYTIGGLARAAEVPITTIRYYERAGLLPPEARSGGNYRSYTERSLERLRFIRAAQANGFTLGDVKQLLRLQDGEPCGEVRMLIEARLRELEERLDQLRSARTVLRASLDACHRGEAFGRCDVLRGLAEGHPPARRAAKSTRRRANSR